MKLANTRVPRSHQQRRNPLPYTGIAVASIFLAACSHGSGTASQSASALASDPALKKAEQTVTKRAQRCLAHGNFLTKSGRKAIATCVANGADPAKVQNCLTSAAADNGVLTHGQRERTLDSFVTCVAGLKVKESGK